MCYGLYQFPKPNIHTHARTYTKKNPNKQENKQNRNEQKKERIKTSKKPPNISNKVTPLSKTKNMRKSV